MSQTSKKLAALAGTAVSTTLLASEASAGIVYKTTPISVAPGELVDLLWDIDGNGTTNINFNLSDNNKTVRDVNYQRKGAGSVLGTLNSLPNLAAGYTVSSGRGFRNVVWSIVKGSGFNAASGFTLNTPGFIGFKFNPTGTDLYGWASITFTPGSLVGITINEWAYEDTGLSIAVGDTGSGPASVPEPSTLALMAMGIGGIYQMKRRRKKAEPTVDDAVSG